MRRRNLPSSLLATNGDCASKSADSSYDATLTWRRKIGLRIQPELDDLFITEVLGEIGMDLIFVDGMLALFEQIRINAALLSHARLSACCPHKIEEVVDYVLR